MAGGRPGRWLRAIGGANKRTRLLAVATLVAVALALLLAGFPLLTPQATLASTTTLTILSGSAEVQTAGTAGWLSGTDGMVLKAGDRVRTLPDSHALITFFEGSTVELEPNTDLTIRELEAPSTSPATTIVLAQWVGKTWHRVVQLADPASRYEIETPSTVATVRGTLVDVEVGQDGATALSTVQGAVQVSAERTQVMVNAGTETTVAPGQPPEPAAAIPPPQRRVRLDLDETVWMRVVDPQGRSIGIVPPGLEVNQIPGATTTGAKGGAQTIELPDLPSGEYRIVFYPKGTGAFEPKRPGAFELKATGLSQTAEVFSTSTKQEIAGQSALVSTMRVGVDNGNLTSGNVDRAAPAAGPLPGKVVVPAPAAPPPTPTPRPAPPPLVAPKTGQALPSYRAEAAVSAPRPPLDPSLTTSVSNDKNVMPGWVAEDRGGFRAMPTPEAQQGVRGQSVAGGPAAQAPLAPLGGPLPGPGSAAAPLPTAVAPQPATKPRALTGVPTDPGLSRLAPKFNSEPAAFGMAPTLFIPSSPTPGTTATPVASPTPATTPAAVASPTPAAINMPAPTATPAASPTAVPAGATPTPIAPAASPASAQTVAPTATSVPTSLPTIAPTPVPTLAPTPTPAPTLAPTPIPTPIPTPVPTQVPPPPPPPTATPDRRSLILVTDRTGQSIVQGQNMKPGDSVAGPVTLTNAGTLPFVYSLTVLGGSGPLWYDRVNGLQLTVIRAVDSAVLYRGPLAAATGPMGGLKPGESVLLILRVSLPTSAGSTIQGSSLTVDFEWTAVEPP